MKEEFVKEVFKNATETMKNNFNHITRGIKFEEREIMKRDMRQRFDEICLLYSDLFEISFVKAKEELKIDDIYLKEAEK